MKEEDWEQTEGRRRGTRREIKKKLPAARSWARSAGQRGAANQIRAPGGQGTRWHWAGWANSRRPQPMAETGGEWLVRGKFSHGGQPVRAALGRGQKRGGQVHVGCASFRGLRMYLSGSGVAFTSTNEYLPEIPPSKCPRYCVQLKEFMSNSGGITPIALLVTASGHFQNSLNPQYKIRAALLFVRRYTVRAPLLTFRLCADLCRWGNT